MRVLSRPCVVTGEQMNACYKQFGSEEDFNTAFAKVMTRVYGYMFLGLIVTALVAFWISGVDAFWEWYFESAWGMWVILLSPLAMLFVMSGVERVGSHVLDVVMFMLFSALFGFSIAVIVKGYTNESVFSTFVITCALFGIMSGYGLLTKRCLRSWGSFLLVGLIGVVIALVVNIFIMSSVMSFIISVVGIVIFLGLTAYDTQMIKQQLLESPSECHSKKVAIQGAIMLYLNFVNLFLHLLSLFGVIDN